MPDAEEDAGRNVLQVIRHSGLVLPLFALSGGLVLALRIVQRDEFWSDRTYWLVAIAAFGGFVGALTTRMFLGAPPLRRLAARFPRLVAAALFTGLFMLGMMVAYIAQNLIFGGQFEPHPDRPIRAVVVNAIQTAALFLISCPTYLLPWPLPVLATLAGVLLAPEVPAAPPKPVE